VTRGPCGAGVDGESSSSVLVGCVRGVHGLRGWIRVQSHTQPVENILDYSPWQLRLEQGCVEARVSLGRCHGCGIVVKLEGVDDRDAARRLVGAAVMIDRAQLPAPGHDEFYWIDLIGLRVVDTSGVELGIVDHLIETGSNDVLVIEGERQRLVPFILESVVKRVDLSSGLLIVDWERDD